MKNIIAEVHSSFSQAEETLLKEAKEVLVLGEDADAKKSARKLSSLGFTNSKAVTKLSEQELRKAKALTESVEKYQQLFPMHKFITEEKVTEICKKYGLVFGDVSLYRADIPEKNVQEIIDFAEAFNKSETPEVQDYKQFVWHSSKGDVKVGNMEDDHLINTIAMIRRSINSNSGSTRIAQLSMYAVQALGAMLYESTERGFYGNDSMSGYSVRYHELDDAVRARYQESVSTTTQGGMLIAADIQSFEPLPKYKYIDPSSYRIKHDTDREMQDLEEERLRLMREYDPIVLQPVENGFLVVSKWGDEASDPDAHSPRLN